MMDQLDTPLAELEGIRVSPSHGDLSGSSSKCAVARRLRRNRGDLFGDAIEGRRSLKLTRGGRETGGSARDGARSPVTRKKTGAQGETLADTSSLRV